MLRKCKYFLLSFVFFISTLLPCISVYAQGTSWTAEEKVRFVGNAFYKIFTDISGVLVPSGLNGQNLQRDFQSYVLNSDVIQNNMTYDEWIASEIGITYKNGDSGDADIVYSPSFQNTVNNFAHDWVNNNNGYIFGYSQSCSEFRTYFNSQVDYDNFVSFVNQHDNNILLVTQLKNVSNNPIGIYEILEFSDVPYDFVKYSRTDQYTFFYIYKDWTLKNKYSDVSLSWVYDFDNHTWSSRSLSSNNSVMIKNPILENSSGLTVPFNSSQYFMVIDSTINQYQIFNSVSAMRDSSQGVQPYYITDSFNSNWQDNSITDSYNTTTTSVNNTISYEDVSNYVNNYYVENNSYPSTNTVYNYINNYVPPDNGGNGGDNGGGGSNIFDFLGTIGDFLGNLIQGIGNVISGILSALTDVIDMFIGENGLPNVIGQLISYFLPFLPDWIPTVIGLSVTLALLIGIVKLIRGS